MGEQEPPQETFFEALAANYEAGTGGCARELVSHIVDILPPVDANSVVLDNACGNGMFSQELFVEYPDTPLTVSCADIAPSMIELARRSVPQGNPSSKVSFEVMPGEKLSFPDETFTHSVTSLGIFFFKDAAAGAREIYRTLKPGGTAVLTSWKVPGHLEPVYTADRAVKPEGPHFKWPVDDAWFEGSHLTKTLENAGFKDVEIHEFPCTYGANAVEDLCRYQMGLWKQIGPKWTDEENAQFEKELLAAGKRLAVKAKRPRNGKKDPEIVEVVGYPMVAYVAVAKK
ncbi:methyltransferase type 11 [Curvularia clavata]|uniref:Methyltransferase type 11 n=1 Tax=Curvularia clavata TaxID=95742 RepID=A0A9Q9DRL7_CURCL|nr:methyltransferase type 11 [Curvularia clavata]